MSSARPDDDKSENGGDTPCIDVCRRFLLSIETERYDDLGGNVPAFDEIVPTCGQVHEVIWQAGKDHLQVPADWCVAAKRLVNPKIVVEFARPDFFVGHVSPSSDGRSAWIVARPYPFHGGLVTRADYHWMVSSFMAMRSVQELQSGQKWTEIPCGLWALDKQLEARDVVQTFLNAVTSEQKSIASGVLAQESSFHGGDVPSEELGQTMSFARDGKPVRVDGVELLSECGSLMLAVARLRSSKYFGELFLLFGPDQSRYHDGLGVVAAVEGEWCSH